MRFLDLKLEIKDKRVTVDLYHKPLNRHAYLPAMSCHPRHQLEAAAHSESHRIFTLAPRTRREAHVRYLVKNLARRGFRPGRVRAIVSWVERKFLFGSGSLTCASKKTERAAVLKLMYSHRTDLASVRRIVRHHAKCLASHQNVRVLPSLQRNLFLRLYKDAWCSK